MKRFILCTLAVLLTSGALLSKPAGACPANNPCNHLSCLASCTPKGAYDGVCGGICNLTCFCIF